ncbi:hypothetical protein ACOMHN_063969 [Nucella lapillus]
MGFAYYPPETLPKDHAAVLVCCGPGNNGGDGLVCARHLKLFGYKPSIFYPKINNKPLFQNLRRQCEQMDMPFLSFFPSEAHLIADSYNLVVDAIFGHNYKGPATPEFATILDKLKQIQGDVPVCSIDIPSGRDIVKKRKGKKEGKKEGMKEGRKKGGKEGRKEGRNEGRNEEKKEGRREGKEGRKEGREGKRKGRKEGRKEEDGKEGRREGKRKGRKEGREKGRKEGMKEGRKEEGKEGKKE